VAAKNETTGESKVNAPVNVPDADSTVTMWLTDIPTPPGDWHETVVAELHADVRQLLWPSLIDGVLLYIAPKFRPEIVTLVPPLAAAFGLPSWKLITGVSKLNVTAEVPTAAATVNFDLMFTPPMLAVHCTVETLDQVVVEQAASSRPAVGV
jgi:hypothetical protein